MRGKNKEVLVFLEDVDEGVKVKIEGTDGNVWCVCSINHDGKLFLYDSISDDAGLQVDKKGVIIIDREE